MAAASCFQVSRYILIFKSSKLQSSKETYTIDQGGEVAW